MLKALSLDYETKYVEFDKGPEWQERMVELDYVQAVFADKAEASQRYGH